MKNLITIFLTGFLFMSFFSTANAKSDLPVKYGSSGALRDPAITLKEGLIYAIEDEYLEQAQYQLIVGKFGPVRPFTEIIAARQKHISMLLILCKKYKVPSPVDRGKIYSKEPSNLREAYQVAIESERENIEMYKKMCAIKDFPTDVQSMMQRFGYISENHLVSFKRELLLLQQS